MARRTIVIAASLALLWGCDRAPEATAPDPHALALNAAVKSGAEAGFYTANEWKMAWTPERVAALHAAIAGRQAHGLDRVAFDDAVRAGASAEQADVAHTRVALAYAGALARGHVDPARTNIYTVPRPTPDLAAGLAQALREDRVQPWLEGLAPQDDAYRALSTAYQARRDTPAAASLAVALERLRWLERTSPATRIDVNIAAARMTYWRDGAIADSRVVVVGAPATKTPQLGSPLFRLVANPTWTIPRSIIRKDRLDQRSAASLARSNMAWRNGRLVQAAGPRNSLGAVKFDLRNGYAIYLHDTPAKSLFAAAQRHRSHGCVRVSDAAGFATLIANDAGIADRWQKAATGGRTVYLPLPREIPVRLIYATVLLDANGAPVQLADPYGWDAPIASRLGFAMKERADTTAQSGDIGP